MSDDAVRQAVEALRKAMVDNGMDEGTANALTSAAMPQEVNIMGNLADLQRMGAAAAKGADPVEEGFAAIPDVIAKSQGDPEDGPVATVNTTTGADAPLASSPDFGAMTKQQLQDHADDEGIDGVDMGSQTKAEMIAAITNV